MGNLVDRKFIPIISIQDYLWGVHPEQLVALKNKFYGTNIKIEKEIKDDRK